MSDFVTMQRRILREIDREGESSITAVVQDAIRTAISFYAGQRFWFNEQRWTASTSTSIEYYSLPQNYRNIDTLKITVNSNRYVLHRRTWHELEEIAQSAQTYSGYPTDYAIQRNELRLYPIPNNQFTLELAGQADLTELSSDAATNAWMVHGEEMIRSRAIVDLLETYLQDYDRPRIEIYIRRERENFIRLKSESTDRILTGRVRRSMW